MAVYCSIMQPKTFVSTEHNLVASLLKLNYNGQISEDLKEQIIPLNRRCILVHGGYVISRSCNEATTHLVVLLNIHFFASQKPGQFSFCVVQHTTSSKQWLLSHGK